jgi:hypothetical protein
VPKLLAFLPCDQVIISKDDDSVSLITVAQGFSASVRENVLGQNILIPHKWSMFAYWLKEAGDEGITFEQQLEYLAPPDNTALMNQISQFVITKATHSQIGRVGALPIRSVGAGPALYTLRLSIRPVGDQEYRVVSEFPITITIDVASSEAVSRK